MQGFPDGVVIVSTKAVTDKHSKSCELRSAFLVMCVSSRILSVWLVFQSRVRYYSRTRNSAQKGWRGNSTSKADSRVVPLMEHCSLTTGCVCEVVPCIQAYVEFKIPSPIWPWAQTWMNPCNYAPHPSRMIGDRWSSTSWGTPCHSFIPYML